jgi:hypothetical protein
MRFELEDLGEFDIEFETALGNETGTHVGPSDG